MHDDEVLFMLATIVHSQGGSLRIPRRVAEEVEALGKTLEIYVEEDDTLVLNLIDSEDLDEE